MCCVVSSQTVQPLVLHLHYEYGGARHSSIAVVLPTAEETGSAVNGQGSKTTAQKSFLKLPGLANASEEPDI